MESRYLTQIQPDNQSDLQYLPWTRRRNNNTQYRVRRVSESANLSLHFLLWFWGQIVDLNMTLNCEKLQLKAFQIWQRFHEQTQQPWRTGSALLVYQFCGHLHEVADSCGKQCITIKCNNSACNIKCLLKLFQREEEKLMECIAADIKVCVCNQILCFRQKKGKETRQ